MRDYCLPVAAAAAMLVCLYAFSPNFRYASGPQATPYGGDFVQEWIGGWIARAGEGARFYDVEYAYRLEHDPELVGFAWNEDEYLPLVYPPFYYLAISPLSLAPFHAAAWIWTGLMLAALFAALWLMLRQARRTLPPTSARFLPWIVPAAVLYPPVVESLSSSQKGALCLLILTATYVLWNSRRPLAAGLVFGLIAFKPQLALVIVAAALWQRQWRFLGGLAATCAALLGLSLCLGVDVCRQYVEFALHTGDYMQTSGYDLYKSHSIWGFAALLMPRADHGMRMCFSLLLAGLIAHQLSRLLRGGLAPGGGPFGLQYAGLVLASILISPHLFTYDLTILLLPMGLILAWEFAASNRVMATERSAPSTTGRASAWLVALLYFAPAISTTLAAKFGVQITVPIMLAALGVLARRMEAAARRSAALPAAPIALGT